MDSIHLVKSLKKEVQGHLTSKDIEFCKKIIKNGITGKEKKDMTTDYLNTLAQSKVKFSDIAETANRIDIYLTVFQSLLFSYNLQPGSSLEIPAKYYAPAPSNFESLLVALPNLIVLNK